MGGSKPSIMTEETFRLIVVLLIQVIFVDIGMMLIGQTVDVWIE